MVTGYEGSKINALEDGHSLSCSADVIEIVGLSAEDSRANVMSSYRLELNIGYNEKGRLIRVRLDEYLSAQLSGLSECVVG